LHFNNTILLGESVEEAALRA